jgi:hypothetical protein
LKFGEKAKTEESIGDSNEVSNKKNKKKGDLKPVADKKGKARKTLAPKTGGLSSLEKGKVEGEEEPIEEFDEDGDTSRDENMEDQENEE